jgi:NRPS condensation-like uncharacterized protein
MTKYSVEMLDEYIRLQEIVNDHRIRCSMVFDSHLNVQRLKAAIVKTIEIIPLLACHCNLTDGRLFWEESVFNIDQALVVVSDDHYEQHLIDYLSKKPEPDGPQIHFYLVQQEKKDALIINVNHMVFDGSGFKTYLYLLASLYTDVEKPIELNSQIRSMDGLLRNISPVNKISSLFRKSLNTAKINLFKPDENEITPRLAQMKLNADQVNKISILCHQHHFTLNDFIIGLFASSVLRLDGIKPQDQLSIQMMFDLRRYVDQYPVSEYANFSSMESIVVQKSNYSFIESIREIGNQTSRIKAHFPGIKNIILLNSLFQLMPIKQFDSRVAKTIKSLGFSTSNLGIINDQELTFADIQVTDCAMYASIKNQPGLQCSFSTFKGNIWLSFLGNYSASNWVIVEKILANMNTQVQEVLNQNSF